MPAIVSLLRGVNLGGHRKIKMDVLAALYRSLGFPQARTHLQSGNVVFLAPARNLAALTRKIEDGIERTFGFHSDVMLRTAAEMRGVVARNPCAARQGIEPNKFAVWFLAGEPAASACDKARNIQCAPDEFWIDGREVYIYFVSGMARPKLSMALLEKTLATSGTTRNWNTVQKLVEIAELMEAS